MIRATVLARISPRVILALLLAGVGACRSETSDKPSANITVPNPDTSGMQSRVFVQIDQMRQAVLKNFKSA